MIATIHLITGAMIGKKIPSPIAAWILSFFSHFLLDAIPHSEYSSGRYWIILLIADISIGLLAVFWLMRNEPKKNKIIILISSLLSTLPDFLNFAYLLFLPQISSLPTIGDFLASLSERFYEFHLFPHADSPFNFLTGTINQILFLILAFYLFVKNPNLKQ